MTRHLSYSTIDLNTIGRMPSDPSPSGRTIVIAARHGERQDYASLVAGENWVKTAVRPWDPPLSDLGWKQGAALGECIKRYIQDLNLPTMTQIYSSPFQRCRETAVAANTAFANSPLVKVEYGLAESLSEPWYRSWSLPTSNGSWGYREVDESGKIMHVNLDTLHWAALQPASSIIAPSPAIMNGVDSTHKSYTKIQKVYCWGSFESNRDQRHRMKSVLQAVAKPNQTVVLISHGGPVTHLYEALTGNEWWVHGEAGYASFSIYEWTREGKWEPLVLNEDKHVPYGT